MVRVIRLDIVCLCCSVLSLGCGGAESPSEDPADSGSPQDVLKFELNSELGAPPDLGQDIGQDLGAVDAPEDIAAPDLHPAQDVDASAGADLEPADTGSDACEPACEGKVCGPDGCGGICGFCQTGFICEPDGSACTKYCVTDCDAKGKKCGDNGCKGSCGTCEQGFTCGQDFLCHEDACVGSCAGKQCGDDGCGKICGQCAAGDYCEDGTQLCKAGPCKGLDPKTGTKCDGDMLLTCIGPAGPTQKLETLDCALLPPAGSKICKFETVPQKYACVDKPPCTPSCAGKQCGDDGCGGTCSECPGGWACLGSECLPSAGGDCAGVVTSQGKCYDNKKMLYYCVGNKVNILDCSAAGQGCSWNAGAAKFTCQ